MMDTKLWILDDRWLRKWTSEESGWWRGEKVGGDIRQGKEFGAWTKMAEWSLVGVRLNTAR